MPISSISQQHVHSLTQTDGDPNVGKLFAEILRLRDQVNDEGRATFGTWRSEIDRRQFLAGALNMAHYLALRRSDRRPLQDALTPLGLSSLGRSEARVLPSLDAIAATLAALAGDQERALTHPPARAIFRGARQLERNTNELFGVLAGQRGTRIMVTLPSEAATDPALVAELVANGMDCARINCSHDDPDAWEAMARNVRVAAAAASRGCKVLMDLGGPKPRTTKVRVEKSSRRLHPGDTLLLARHDRDDIDLRRFPFQACCTIPEVLDQLRAGEPAWLDDGRLGATVAEVRPEGVVLSVTSTRSKGERLREDKGLNFPETVLDLSPLTARDLVSLDVVVRTADIVGYSFVQRPEDIDLLREELARRDPAVVDRLGLIAKIETRLAVRNLPALIVRGAGGNPFGVMIARGDLLVELGFLRMAEMQEELLWLCEAAHVPIIWATQVLEGLVKTGSPSRAELTDATMSVRAECVMLNKGPFVVAGVAFLDDLLSRMQDHQMKKTPRLRALHAWE